MNAVEFFNRKIGYVAGYERFLNKINDEVTGSAEIYCTKDGGLSWQKCYQENELSTVFQIVAFSETEALVVLDGMRLIRTENGGRSWHSVSIPTSYIYSVAFAPNGVGWAVGKGSFLSSSDRGRAWYKPNHINQKMVESDWSAICFNSAGIGIAVGEDGAIAITSDGGGTWEQLELINSDDLRAVQIQGSNAIFRSGEDVLIGFIRGYENWVESVIEVCS